MKSKKENMVDEHLLHIIKNTTAFDRMVWLKKNIDFFKKMQTRKQNSRIKKNKI